MKIFDTLIMPILIYSGLISISDFKIDLLDKSYQFEKDNICILVVNRKTSNFCKCDLCRFHILIVILKQVLSYYQRLKKLPANRF